jgi:hypothetical protein
MFYCRCWDAQSARCLPQRNPAECSRLEHAPRVNQTPPKQLPTTTVEAGEDEPLGRDYPQQARGGISAASCGPRLKTGDWGAEK